MGAPWTEAAKRAAGKPVSCGARPKHQHSEMVLCCRKLGTLQSRGIYAMILLKKVQTRGNAVSLQVDTLQLAQFSICRYSPAAQDVHRGAECVWEVERP